MKTQKLASQFCGKLNNFQFSMTLFVFWVFGFLALLGKQTLCIKNVFWVETPNFLFKIYMYM